MIDARRLEIEQPVVFQVLRNGLEQQRISHAYLFVGASGTPKLDTAYLLAKSILCEEEGIFACGTCSICRRIEENIYTDMIVLDGSVSSIKKEQVLKLQEQFHKTGLERYGKKIYIINDVENTSPEALNSLLKFLEEPTGDLIYGILITSKLDQVLDTIISRCQNITFRPISVDACVVASVALGVDQEDANILSRITKDPQRINEISLEESYHKTKTYFYEVMEVFIMNGWQAAYTMQRIIKEDKKFDKDTMVLLVEFMIVFFQEAMYGTFVSSQPQWNVLIKEASGLENLSDVLQVLLETKDVLQHYPNLNLLVDQLFYRMMKGVS